MKRPVAGIGAAYLLAAAAAVFCPPAAAAALAGLLGAAGLLALVCSRHPARRAAAAVLLAAGVGCGAARAAVALRVEPLRALAGQTALVEGTVAKVAGPRSIELAVGGGAVAVTSREQLAVRPGDRFSAVLVLERYEAGRDTLYARSKALTVPLRGFAPGEYDAAPPEAGSPAALLRAARDRLAAGLGRLLPGEEGAVLRAMLLGQRDGIPRALTDAYSAAGVSHLLAISGYHVAVLSGLLALLLRALRCPPRAGRALVILLLLLYWGLVGPAASVGRAVLMAVLYQAARLAGRQSDPYTSLALAGVLLCAADPLAVTDAGFQLSFLATLGIQLCAGRLASALARRLGEPRFPRLRGLYLPVLAMTFSASLFTLPVTLLLFEEFALYAPAANLLAAPLVPAALACGLAAALLAAVPGARLLAPPFALAAGLAVKLLNSTAGLVAGLPFARLPAGAGFVRVWLAGAAVLAACALYGRKNRRRRLAAAGALCAVTLFAGVLSFQLALRGAAQVTVLPTGDGAVLVAVKDGRAAVVGDVNGASDAYAVRMALRRAGVSRVELFALSPARGRRNTAAAALLEEYRPGLAVLDPADLADDRFAAALARAGAVCAWGDLSVSLFGGDEVRIRGGEVCANFSGVKTFLLTGKCGILDCTGEFGAPDAVVLGAAAPPDLDRLRCRLLVTNGLYHLSGLADETVVLDEDGAGAAFLARRGALRPGR